MSQVLNRALLEKVRTFLQLKGQEGAPPFLNGDDIKLVLDLNQLDPVQYGIAMRNSIFAVADTSAGFIERIFVGCDAAMTQVPAALFYPGSADTEIRHGFIMAADIRVQFGAAPVATDRLVMNFKNWTSDDSDNFGDVQLSAGNVTSSIVTLSAAIQDYRVHAPFSSAQPPWIHSGAWVTVPQTDPTNGWNGGYILPGVSLQYTDNTGAAKVFPASTVITISFYSLNAPAGELLPLHVGKGVYMPPKTYTSYS